ncbi:hypothetical protein SLS55_005470 [Diplodia seriata]|uniref:SKP1 component dimerisation domain-containing protein n=1 Tax=Diplodia seriata TaxID=420778 RepID=A0ABR3CGI0_9PEZI
MSVMRNNYIALKANNGVVIDVNAQILRTILEWCEHHKNDDTSRKIDYIRTPFYALPPIDKWDQDFMSGADLDTLFEITATAHFLDIPALYDLGCRTIASTIAGKSPSEVRDMLGTHDIPIGEENEPETPIGQLPPWNAAKRLLISPLVQLAESITGGQPINPRSSAEFPPITSADLPASYAHRTTWSDFTWVRVHLYHFSSPRSNACVFGAGNGAGIHLRVAALGCHPWVVARRGERRRYCCSAAADDDDLPMTTSSSSRRTSSVAGLYLSTEPLPPPTLDYQLWLPIAHRVVFQVRTAGQGWLRGSREGGGGGDMKEALNPRHAWFEASILTPVLSRGLDRLATDGATLQDVMAEMTWETPARAREALVERGWDFVEREDGGVVWKVCDGVTTSGEYRDRRVEWKRGVETQVGDEGEAVGRGEGFLERLTTGRIVVLWARAEHRYRENKVGAAAIEIEYEFPPPGSTRNDGSPL